MATVNIVIDTANKENSYVEVDGAKLDNVSRLEVYGFDEPEYMYLEIAQYEKPQEDGGLRKYTRLCASQNDESWQQNNKAMASIELAQVIAQREITL